MLISLVAFGSNPCVAYFFHLEGGNVDHADGWACRVLVMEQSTQSSSHCPVVYGANGYLACNRNFFRLAGDDSRTIPRKGDPLDTSGNRPWH